MYDRSCYLKIVFICLFALCVSILPSGCTRGKPENTQVAPSVQSETTSGARKQLSGPISGEASPPPTGGDSNQIAWKGTVAELDAMKYSGRFSTDLKNKWLEFSGTVSQIFAMGPEDSYRNLVLVSDKADLFCRVVRNDAPTGRFSKGQSICLKGIVHYRPGSTVLNPEQCQVVKLGPSQAIELTADSFLSDYVKEYVKSSETAHKKYKDRTLILSGTVAALSKQPSDNSPILVFRPSNSAWSLELHLGGRLPPNYPLPKVGDPVKVTGNYTGTDSKRKVVNFRECELILP